MQASETPPRQIRDLRDRRDAGDMGSLLPWARHRDHETKLAGCREPINPPPPLAPEARSPVRADDRTAVLATGRFGNDKAD